ncbi:MAG: RDD family protein [Methylococcales bacterium]|nr:RDD family protein [Methylococcales bacterium]
MSQNAKKLSKSGADDQSAPSFLCRLVIVFYDFLLLIALLFLATALLLPFNAGQAFTHQQLFYPIYLLIVSFIFYGWFWTHGGQTLGLRAWKAKVLTTDQQAINWTQALVRFVTAFASCGLGFLWIPLDKHRRSWHDYLSKTAVFFDEKK